MKTAHLTRLLLQILDKSWTFSQKDHRSSEWEQRCLLRSWSALEHCRAVALAPNSPPSTLMTVPPPMTTSWSSSMQMTQLSSALEDESSYRELVYCIIVYGEDNDLVFNLDKTKELILDFWKKAPCLSTLSIRETDVEWSDSYKFLGLQEGRGPQLGQKHSENSERGPAEATLC